MNVNKKLLSLLFFALIATGTFFVLTACKKKRMEVQPADPVVVHRQFDHVAKSLVYFKDVRTGHCFAYTYETQGFGNHSNGGPALATVDCDKAAPYLVNVNVEKDSR